MKFITIASCLLFLFADVRVHAQTADVLVAEGRSFLTVQNLTNANARFASALVVSPGHENANLLYAATRLFTVADKPAGKALLDKLGMTATNRSIYAWTAIVPSDTNGVIFAPTNTTARELVDFCRTNLLFEIIGAGTNLAKVNNRDFLLVLTANETSVAKVTVDYGDILLMRAGLKFAQYAIYTINSWNFDVQLESVRSIFTGGTTAENLLNQLPGLFTFANTNDLSSARQAFSEGVALYTEASDFIRSRATNVVRLFNIAPESAVNELLFRSTLIELKQSLNGPVVLAFHPHVTVNFAQHFNNAPRAFLPQVLSNSFAAGTLPDPTFGGLIQGLPRHEVEKLMGAERHLGLPFVSKFAIPVRLPDGSFVCTFASIDGTLLVVQGSPDLQSWHSVETVCITNGTFSFIDNTAIGATARYYRTIDLSRDLPPDFHTAHDAFTNRAVLSGANASGIGAIYGATLELNEGSHAGVDGGSIWWTWTAPASGSFSLDTFGSAIAVGLAVYQGTSVGGLSVIASDAGSGPDFSSYLVLFATAGQTYQIAVAAPWLDSGKIVLNLKQLPSNDAFDNRILIVGGTNAVTGSNVNATKEPDEPEHAGNEGGRSVWWTWTAPMDGFVTIDTFGSSFDTLLAVYVGDGFYDLPIASNDDDGSDVRSRVVFAARAGSTYTVAVDGYYGASGSITLNLRQVFAPPPVNNNFSNRLLLTGTNVQTSGVNLSATKETGEPDHANNAGGRSVWWTWTAPIAGRAFVTVNSDFGSLLAVYLGNSVSTLTLVANNEGGISGAEGAFTSTLNFPTVAGTTYQIAVDGYDGALGNIALGLTAIPRPANDAFTNRITIAGVSNSVTGNNIAASKEPGEPNHSFEPGGRSVWWTWTAPIGGTVTLDTLGSPFDTLLAVYLGTSVSNLTRVTSDFGSGGGGVSTLSFSTVAGATYQIAVDGYASGGDIVLNLQQVAAAPVPPQVVFVTYPGSAAVGAPIDFEAGLAGTFPMRLQWYKNSAAIPGATNATFSILAAQAGDAGTYSLRVTNAAGNTASANLPLTISAPPSNDNFTNRFTLTGKTNTVTANNSLATKESGEPNHAGNGGGKSLWWTWSAPATGAVTVDTIGSNFDTTLGIYTGSVVSALTTIAFDDDGGGNTTSSATFSAVAGTAYQIAVDGYDGVSGSIALHVRQP